MNVKYLFEKLWLKFQNKWTKKRLSKIDRQTYIIMENPYSSGWKPYVVCSNIDAAKRFISDMESKYVKYEIQQIKQID